eukprot:923559-Prymnesium_polylepis.1
MRFTGCGKHATRRLERRVSRGMYMSTPMQSPVSPPRVLVSKIDSLQEQAPAGAKQSGAERRCAEAGRRLGSAPRGLQLVSPIKKTGICG